MTDTLLWQAFITLEKRELRELRKFVNSPYFNQRDDVAGLFDYLHKCTLNKNQKPSKEKAFEALFPNTIFDDHKIRLASSFLLQLMEDFWVAEAAKMEKAKAKRIVAQQYRQRHLEKHFQRTLQEAKSNIESQVFRNADFHWQNYQISIENYRHNAAERRSTDLNLQEISNSLDNTYYTLKLRQACILMNHQTMYRADYQINMINEIVQQIEIKQLFSIPSIAVYYYAYQSIIHHDDDEYFYALKSKLSEFGNLFPAEEIRDLYLIAINYCIKKHNNGNPSFLKAELEIYEEGLKFKYLHINGFISRFTYRNVVTLALTLQEYDWVEQFIEDFKNDIEPIHREGNYNYCRARLAYERNDYKQVFSLLQQADYEEILITLAAKSLLLKVFYETEANDALEAHLEAMRSYIRRKANIGYHQENYLNLIKFTKRLLKIDLKNKKEVIQLKEEINTTQGLAERKWLLDILLA
jgi:hypothetical protein